MSDLDKYKVNARQRPKGCIPLHAQKALMVKEREGYKRYVMNDVPGARERFELAGYTAATDQDSNQCDKNVNHAKQIGKELTLTVNKGINAPCNTATVMEIPQEWYDEDARAAQKIIDSKEEALNPENNNVFGSTYGSLKKGKEIEQK